MEPLIRNTQQKSSSKGLKTFALFSLAVLGTIAACYAVYGNQANTQVLQSQEQALGDVFTEWMKTYGVTYEDPDMEQYRYQIFKQNYNKIVTTNAQNLGYTLAINQFSALTQEEFASIYLGYIPNPNKVRNVQLLPTDNLPDSVNWTAAGAVTAVKNQGQCGSCWSFSTTGSLEGLNFLTNNNLTSFSEQQLMDCSWKYGNKACEGGEMDDAFKYVEVAGIEPSDDYPYKAHDDLLCHYDATDVAFHISGYTDVQPNSIDQLMAAVAQQPVSIAVEADTWQSYSSGVISSNCGQNLDHGVLAVGYGNTTDGTPYWLVKNSWGADWGMQGYLMIERSTADLCGVLNDPSYPTA